MLALELVIVLLAIFLGAEVGRYRYRVRGDWAFWSRR